MRSALFVIVSLAACTKATPPAPSHVDDAPAVKQTPKGPVPHVVIAAPRGELAVNVEVVSSEGALTRGLMYRQHLPPDDGMLFLMHEENDWGFYMRNTLIPLDMIFITKDMTIAGIVQNAVPLDETNRKVGAQSLYVLEVNGGYSASHGVMAGQKVRFENTEGAAR